MSLSVSSLVNSSVSKNIPCIALVGIGDAGQHHAKALRHLHDAGILRWQATCARDVTKITAFLEQYSFPPTQHDIYTNISDLCDAQKNQHSLDAVILATPDGLHAEQIRQCAAAGLHILVEKPIALSHTDAQNALKACQEAGIYIQAGYHLRQHGAHQHIAQELQRIHETQDPQKDLEKDPQQKQDRLQHIHLFWAWPDPAVAGWRAQGDAVNNRKGWWSLSALGTHLLDLARFFDQAAGGSGEIADLFGSHQTPDVETSCILRFASGVTAQIHCSVQYRSPSLVTVRTQNRFWQATGTLGARPTGDLSVHHTQTRQTEICAYPERLLYAEQLREFATRIASPTAASPTRTTPTHIPTTRIQTQIQDALWNISIMERL